MAAIAAWIGLGLAGGSMGMNLWQQQKAKKEAEEAQKKARQAAILTNLARVAQGGMPEMMPEEKAIPGPDYAGAALQMGQSVANFAQQRQNIEKIGREKLNEDIRNAEKGYYAGTDEALQRRAALARNVQNAEFEAVKTGNALSGVNLATAKGTQQAVIDQRNAEARGATYMNSDPMLQLRGEAARLQNQATEANTEATQFATNRGRIMLPQQVHGQTLGNERIMQDIQFGTDANPTRLELLKNQSALTKAQADSGGYRTSTGKPLDFQAAVEIKRDPLSSPADRALADMVIRQFLQGGAKPPAMSLGPSSPYEPPNYSRGFISQ